MLLSYRCICWWSRLKFEKTVSLILAVQLFLSLLLLFSSLKIQYRPTVHRVTSIAEFNINFNINSILIPILLLSLFLTIRKLKFRDILIIVLAILTLPLLGFNLSLVLISFIHIILAFKAFKPWRTFFTYLFLLLSIFEAAATVHWILLYPLNVNYLFGDLAMLELSVYYVFAQVTPLFTTFLMYHWIPILLSYGFKLPIPSILKLNFQDALPLKFNPKLLLFFSTLISMFSAIYPYLPTVNPADLPVGVDIKYYVNYTLMAEIDPLNAFKVSGGSRPIIVLLLLLLKRLTNLDVWLVVKFLPLILNPLLTLSTYFLVKSSTGDEFFASLSALLTSLGYKLTVNMYSYFLADITALILIYFSMALLFDSLKSKSKLTFACSTILFSLSIFTHPWTFTQYYISLLFFPLAEIFERRSLTVALKAERRILILLVFSGFIDILKSFLIGGLEGASATTGTVGHQSPIGFLNYWNNTIFSHLLLYGGFQSNLLINMFSIFGALIIWRMRYLGKFLSYSFIASSIPYFFVNGTLQSRLFFNLPVEILFSYSIYSIIRCGRIPPSIRNSFLLFIISSQLAYLFRSLANLILI